mgnify:CR=1 FL=1
MQVEARAGASPPLRVEGFEDVVAHLMRALGEARAAAGEVAAAVSRLAMVAVYREGKARTGEVDGWAKGATVGRALELLREFYGVYRRNYPVVLSYAISAAALARDSAAAELVAALERRARNFERAMAELEAAGLDPNMPCSKTEACEPVEKAIRKAVNVAYATEDVIAASIEVVRRLSAKG